MDISDFRRSYTQAGLSRSDLNADPYGQFEQWFQQACEAQLLEPNAMVLGTVSAEGAPCLRTVLLKFFDAGGLVFFTNYESRKAQQMAENAQVSVLFPWLALERQVQIQGTVAKIPAAESLQYFTSRPRSSQLGAWTSRQSRAIASRQVLEDQFEATQQQFRDQDIPLPPFWGGYRISPISFEFWQGRPSRLHDRFLYTKAADHTWQIQRLSP